ncbi:MAG TPA: LrgB family protein [Candidatus Monoglobus merdigallinarum]|uniref:LrgB family protein n=1 Tax=Candidatus Monoglobus merdigallinarum TaxID=2838698 RepID=A0A9D1PPQ4_9FIRM|nr:LrgB family protein [Candidatus Monoglobus merdigallinarum]
MTDAFYSLTSNAMFGAALTIFAYLIGVSANKKLRTPIANPVLIADAIIIMMLLLLDIPYENYKIGGDMVETFLAPVTAALAVKIHSQLKELKENWLPLIIGSAVGSLASILCVLAMCRMFGLSDSVTASLIPKSVTTAIAVPISVSGGGIPAVTVIALMFTGMLGAMFSPLMIKIFKIKNPIAAGTAIGTSSHALGTTKALEIGDVEGAMSGIAIGLAGLITTIYTMFMA